MPLISVTLPSRGRPDSLRRAVSSLAGGDVEILVGLDLDDPTAPRARKLIEGFPGVRVILLDRQPTVSQIHNRLADEATGDYIQVFTDDYEMIEPGWVETTREALSALPTDLGIVYPHDLMYPHFSSLPIISRKTREMAGYYLPPFFPFLFGDTWWNEIGVMSCMILPSRASVKLSQETGHIHNFRNVKLWSTLFDKLRPMREQLAIQMIRAALGEGGDYLVSTVPDRSQACADLHAPCMTEEFFDKWNKWGDGFPHPHYAAIEARAQSFMEQLQ